MIELDRRVLDEKKTFPYEGKLPTNKKTYYVGITKHTPECRYIQHTAERPDDKMYLCACFTESSIPRTFSKKVKYVYGYNLKLVKTPSLNPTVRTDGPMHTGSAKAAENNAKNKERELGKKLRKEGHAVYWN